ncbi:MAG: DUF3047 domain-containing protein [Lentisphaeria bacterium]|nr:DUF3047 domain-containing protein [Lentisphaeria bacterium]
MKKILAASLLFAALLVSAGNWREDFSKDKPDKKGFPEGWKQEGTLPGVPASKVSLRDGVLHLESDKSSGGLLRILKTVDLNKTPVMRWRWRSLELPKRGDGRDSDRDDQAVGLYLILPGFWQKKSLSYHYETETPKGQWGETSYLCGVVKVTFTVLRNETDTLGEWYVEERNVAEDLKKCYGEIPKEFAIGIISNSNNTASRAAAEIDYIEFVPAPAEKAK